MYWLKIASVDGRACLCHVNSRVMAGMDMDRAHAAFLPAAYGADIDWLPWLTNRQSQIRTAQFQDKQPHMPAEAVAGLHMGAALQ